MTVQPLSGKVAIITGGGSGIGAASCHAFASAGAKIVSAGRTMDSVQRVANDIEARQVEALALEVDVSQEDAVRDMVAATLARFGRIDVLFNNAGISPAGRVTEIEESAWDECLNINLKSVFLCAKHMIPHMRDYGGVILNTAGTFGLLPATDKAAYSAAKAGVINLTRSIALDYSRDNVRCNAICPGFVDTPLTANFTGAERDAFLARHQPLPGVIQPEDVAQMAVWLASDAARMITGQVFLIDGGQQAGLFQA